MIEKERSLERGLLENKVAIVTGGARGVGKGIALELARGGANIVIADILEEQGKKTSEEVSALGRRSLFIPTDITVENNRVEVVDKTIKTFGTVDILVNDAAIVDFGRDIVLNPTDEESRKVFDTNYHAHVNLSHKIAEIMRKRANKGSIIFITSVHAKLVRMQEHYHASKAALEATMREMAVQYGRFGIRVNAIAPGAINTKDTPSLDDLKIGHFGGEIPLGRMGLPSEIGKVAVFLSSNDFSSYVTGSTITVDGGLSQFNWVTKQYLQNS